MNWKNDAECAARRHAGYGEPCAFKREWTQRTSPDRQAIAAAAGAVLLVWLFAWHIFF